MTGIRRALVRVSFIALFALFAPSTLVAGTFLALGPIKYVRSAGEPVTVTSSFSVLAPATTYTLRIDSSGVSSAVITLNGATIARPSDFNSNARLITKPVPLLARNQLAVELRSAPGSSFTLQIIGVDNLPPVITAATTPAPNPAGWNNSNPTVTFTCMDTTSGVAFCTPPITVITEGASQVVTGTALDKAGNTASASVAVNLDKTPPILMVTSPPDGAAVSNPSVTLTGTASDALSGLASVTCSGAAASIVGTDFTCDVQLTIGTNQIDLAATDFAGNIANASITESYAVGNIGVFNATIEPTDAFVATPINAVVTAEIGADANTPTIVGSVLLYETAADGSLAGQVGRLYDDGTHGDAVAADTRFTMVLPVNEPAPHTRYYRISAAYSGIPNRYFSPVLSINVYPQMPPTLVPAVMATVQDLQNSFLANISILGVVGARQQALAEALSNPNIGSGNANLSGPNLSLMYVSIDPSTGYTFQIPAIAILEDPANPTDGAGRSVPTNLPTNYETPGNDSVLIFGPGYQTADPQNAIVEHAAAQFANTEYMSFDPNPPVITARENASLELVKEWGDYGTVIIHTHGGLWGLNGTQQVVLVSGTPASWWNQFTYVFDILAKRIAVTGDGRFAFYPSFITKYVSGMNDTFLYLGACESLQNDTLWNALQAKGAKVAFGWSETVNRDFNGSTFAALIDPMLPHTNPPDPLSALQAFNGVAVKTDPWGGHNATLTMRTASADWNGFVFSEGGIVNGGFETGDWSGWTHGGGLSDGQNYQVIVGARQHSGSFGAALGRWDSAYSGYDPTLEPGGYEWFYQDFTVPGNATVLSFWWWQETYDTAVWDWFDAYLEDTNGAIMQTLVLRGGKPGVNYGPYWNTGSWQYVSTDVTAYRGQKLRIYFDQRLDGYGDQTRSYVDDVHVQ